MAKFTKGNRPVGRGKGTSNKVTKAVKEMIVEALHNVGGVEYLSHQARKNPTAFMALIGRIIPHQVKQEVSGSSSRPLLIQQIDSLRSLPIEERKRRLLDLVEAVKKGPLRQPEAEDD